MEKFEINGGKKLKGKIAVNGSKNATVAILAASMMNQGITTLKNVPRIEEVNRWIEVLESMGVKIEWEGKTLKIIPPKKLAIGKIDRSAARKTRSVIMLIGALLTKQKKYSIPQAGGCKLGKRIVSPHFFALEKFGIKIKTKRESYEIDASQFGKAEKSFPRNSFSSRKSQISSENFEGRGGCVRSTRRRDTNNLQPKSGSCSRKESFWGSSTVVLYESGDTVTETALMAAAQIPNKTTIKMATANYMVQDLCFFLQKLGVKIKGIGTSTLEVQGLKKIDKNITYTISEDPIEAMFFISLAITTGSNLVIERCPIEFLELELLKLEKMGQKYQIKKEYLSGNKKTQLVDIQIIPSELKALEEKIHALPFPGINMDNLPFFVPIGMMAKGKTLIHDWTYENRAVYLAELNELGAKIKLVDPHRIEITGPSKLKAGKMISPPALRPAACILVVMMGIKGKSVLQDVYSINRGYENLEERLQAIGVDIKMKS